MKILEKEISLREETRAAQQGKPQMQTDKFAELAASLGATQEELADRTEIVIEDIIDLPDGEQKFPKEIQQLTAAVAAMWDAADTLNADDTGPKAIAAETEAIEWLLQAKRSKGGGGGGGSNPGEGNRNGEDTNIAALALLGEGDANLSKEIGREVQQATGKAGSELPAEFRSGLDKYFEGLEKGSN